MINKTAEKFCCQNAYTDVITEMPSACFLCWRSPGRALEDMNNNIIRDHG